MQFTSNPKVRGFAVGLLVGLTLLLCDCTSEAATFCVSTATDLGSALLTAQSNGTDESSSRFARVLVPQPGLTL